MLYDRRVGSESHTQLEIMRVEGKCRGARNNGRMRLMRFAMLMKPATSKALCKARAVPD